MSMVPEHDIHVAPSGDGYIYKISYADPVVKFLVTAKDLETCEQAFRQQYMDSNRILDEILSKCGCFADPGEPDDSAEESVSAPAGAEEPAKEPAETAEGLAEEPFEAAEQAQEQAEESEASPAETAEELQETPVETGKGHTIRVVLDMENMPRDLGNLADLFFDDVYSRDPELCVEDLGRDRDVFNLIVLRGNEARPMSYLESAEVQEACYSFFENGNAETALRMERIVDKMKDLAKGVYALRGRYCRDMKSRCRLLTPDEISALLSGTAKTKYQLMFAVALFMGIDISMPRLIRIHRGFVSTTTDMEELDEMRMHRLYMSGNLDSFIMDKSAGLSPMGYAKSMNERCREYSIRLNLGDPEELQSILSAHCPGHTLEDLSATYWVNGLI